MNCSGPMTSEVEAWECFIRESANQAIGSQVTKVQNLLAAQAKSDSSRFHDTYISRLQSRYRRAHKAIRRITLEKMRATPNIIWNLRKKIDAIVSLGDTFARRATNKNLPGRLYQDIADILAVLNQHGDTLEQSLMVIGTPEEVRSQMNDHFNNTVSRYEKYIGHKTAKWREEFNKSPVRNFVSSLSQREFQDHPGNTDPDSIKRQKEFSKRWDTYEIFLRKMMRRNEYSVDSNFARDVAQMITTHKIVQWVLRISPFQSYTQEVGAYEPEPDYPGDPEPDPEPDNPDDPEPEPDYPEPDYQ